MAELTLDVAREMYNSGNDMMAAFALEAYSKEELENYNADSIIATNYTFPSTWEDAIAMSDKVTRLGYLPQKMETSALLSDETWPNYLWLNECPGNNKLAEAFIALSCLIVMRNVWWKLDNNWFPNTLFEHYVITCRNNVPVIGTTLTDNYILSFRSREICEDFFMRFKDNIEIAKTLL